MEVAPLACRPLLQMANRVKWQGGERPASASTRIESCGPGQPGGSFVAVLS